MSERMLLVRCVDLTVFPVNRESLSPLTIASFDPWCYSDPDPNADYIEHAEWCLRRAERRKELLRKGVSDG